MGIVDSATRAEPGERFVTVVSGIGAAHAPGMHAARPGTRIRRKGRYPITREEYQRKGTSVAACKPF